MAFFLCVRITNLTSRRVGIGLLNMTLQAHEQKILEIPESLFEPQPMGNVREVGHILPARKLEEELERLESIGLIEFEILKTVPAVDGGGGGDFDIDIFRENVRLSGAYDGVGREYTLPDKAIHDPPRAQVKVYHGGRRLIYGALADGGEYLLEESGGTGTGFDTVRLTRFSPEEYSHPMQADYLVDTD